MTEYERGFIDGIKSKVSAELTPTLINVSKTMLEMLKPVLSTALEKENALNDNNAITDTDVQPVKRGEKNNSIRSDNMDEYISRDDALLHSEIIRVYSKDYGNIDVVPVEYLADIPAADVQPVKRGRWVQYNRNGEETYIECTNCCVPSRPRHLQMVTRSGEGLPDYCPYCGARMMKDGDTDA